MGTATLTTPSAPATMGVTMRVVRTRRSHLRSVDDPFPAVLSRAQRGDGQALATLYTTYQPQLGRYLRVCAPNMAEDLASDVWLAVAGRIKSFTGDEAGFRAWLFTVARRRVIDYRRREGRRRTDPVDAGAFAALMDRSDTESTVMASLGTEEALALVERVLTPEQAEVVMLRVVAGLSVAEVAELVGRQEVTVRVMQHRALERLAQRIRPKAEPQPAVSGHAVSGGQP
jgi:RNA polymerase sigma-70 factor, ECF subfamily